MKRMIIFVAFLFASSTFGCAGAWYGSQKQYDEGDHSFYADSREMARIKQDKLAFDKLNSQSVQISTLNGVPQGYEGIISNLDKYNTYNFIISGPERKGYVLKPGESKTDHLTPGTYTATVFQGSYQVGETRVFHVTSQKNYFMGSSYHWYVYMGNSY